MINVADVIEVSVGMHTDVMFSAGLVDPLKCLSLVTTARTLDVSFATTVERDLWVRSLKQLFKAKRTVRFNY